MAVPRDLATRVAQRVTPADLAIRTFDEVEAPYTPAEAVAEARRALTIGADLAAATEGCPFTVDVQAMVSRIADGDFDGARAVVHEAHPFPSVFGRMCHLFCERNMEPVDGTETPSIRELERFVGDYGDPAAVPLPSDRPSSGKRVAIVGAGSGGLAGAWMLRRLGHEVDIFDKLDTPGGMLVTGYPQHRMPKYGVRRDNDPTAWGARFFGGVRVDRARFEQLLDEYDLLLIAMGAHHAYLVGTPGEEIEGVWSALDFLREMNLGRPPSGIGRALVIGAGQTSLDASRSARRLGAEVTVCYRRTIQWAGIGHGGRDPGPEFRTLEDEGIARLFQVQPTRILPDRFGHVGGVEFVRTELGPPGDDGRPVAVEQSGSEFTVSCDTVIEAVGEGAELHLLPEWLETAGGKLAVDKRSHQTSHPRVFAVGDICGDHANEGAAQSAIHAARAMDAILRGEALVLPEPKPLRRTKRLPDLKSSPTV